MPKWQFEVGQELAIKRPMCGKKRSWKSRHVERCVVVQVDGLYPDYARCASRTAWLHMNYALPAASREWVGLAVEQSCGRPWLPCLIKASSSLVVGTWSEYIAERVQRAAAVEIERRAVVKAHYGHRYNHLEMARVRRMLRAQGYDAEVVSERGRAACIQERWAVTVKGML